MEIPIVKIREQTLRLHPFRAALWEERSYLLIADLHLGKAAHFRKNGIPVPMGVTDANWDRLISLLLDFQPDRVLFLGDLFHSSHNAVCEEFGDIVQQFKQISFELVVGNHDILDPGFYEKKEIKLHQPDLKLGPFLFSHFPADWQSTEHYNIAGHLHPSVRLRGNSRQSMRLPCFYFGRTNGILPAFGLFTGTATIHPKKADKVFVIVGDKVVKV